MKKILMAVAAAAASLTGIYAMNITPRPLHDGDKIAIVSPAGPVDSTLVYAAADTLRAQGFLVDIMPHAIGRVGQYAAADSDRLADLRAAFSDTTVRAILCSRGGYGAVHLLDSLSQLPLQRDPKWLIRSEERRVGKEC